MKGGCGGGLGVREAGVEEPRAEQPHLAPQLGLLLLALLVAAELRLRVPVLALLLERPSIAVLARRALQHHPAPEAGRALRAALDTTQGELRRGVIRSLGERAGPEASAALANCSGVVVPASGIDVSFPMMLEARQRDRLCDMQADADK